MLNRQLWEMKNEIVAEDTKLSYLPDEPRLSKEELLQQRCDYDSQCSNLQIERYHYQEQMNKAIDGNIGKAENLCGLQEELGQTKKHLESLILELEKMNNVSAEVEGLKEEEVVLYDKLISYNQLYDEYVTLKDVAVERECHHDSNAQQWWRPGKKNKHWQLWHNAWFIAVFIWNEAYCLPRMWMCSLAVLVIELISLKIFS